MSYDSFERVFIPDHLKCDDPPTITGRVPTKDTNRNVNESFSTESDIDNDATNSLIMNDNFDVKEKCQSGKVQ